MTKDQNPAHSDFLLRPYLEALFPQINASPSDAQGKPRVLGITSCGAGAGVTTFSTELARLVSETIDGSVLLIRLEEDKVSVCSYSGGRAAEDIPTAVEPTDPVPTQALIPAALMDLSVPNGLNRLTRLSLGRRLASVMPMLSQVGYDYVIFDLPPIHETSISLRVCSFFDQLLLMVEAEKTPRACLKQAQELLLKANSNVIAILNKHRHYVPRWLSSEA